MDDKMYFFTEQDKKNQKKEIGVQQGFEELAVAVRKELEENYLPKERIRWGVQTAEQNTIMMMDVLNTLLWLFNAKNCYRVGEITHPVIKESKDELKKR